MRREQALVISSGEIHPVINKYLTYTIYTPNLSNFRLTTVKYLLSNKQSYQESELVVGIENIRNFKILKLI